MSFINPLGLLGLISLPVIVGLHFYLERNLRKAVSSLYLWNFLDQKFQGRKPRRIQLSWLLVLDLLIAGFLSLALAQPELEIPTPLGEDSQVIVLLDVSTSMLAVDAAPSRFTLAKEEVNSILAELGPNQTAAVIAVGERAELIGETGEISIEELSSSVDGLTAGSSSTDIRLGLSLAETMLSDQRPVEVHIFTDGAFDLENMADLPYPTQWHFYGQGGNNQAVSNLELVQISPGEFQIFAELLNYSAEERPRILSVIVNGEEVRQSEITFQPLETVPFVLSLFGDVHYVEVELLGSDLLGEDDLAGAGWIDPDQVSAALVTRQLVPFDRALNAVAGVEVEIIDPEDYSPTVSYDLTIFREYLPDAWPAGLVVVFDPPGESELLQIQGLYSFSDDQELETKLDPITQGLNFSGVRWEGVWKLFDETGFSSLVQPADGLPLIVSKELDAGELIVFLAPTETGNLTQQPVFPLLIANLVEACREVLPMQNYSIGAQAAFDLSSSGSTVTLINPAGMEVDIDGLSSVKLDQFGRYSLVNEDYLGNLTTFLFGVNGGAEGESNIKPRDWVEDFAGEVIEPERNPKLVIDLRPWLLALVVLLLLVEAWRAWR